MNHLSFEERVYSHIGRLIRQHRKEKKYIQSELADKVNLTRTSITNIEKGQQKIQIHTLYAIAEEFGISIYDLIPEKIDDSLRDEERFPGLDDAHYEWIRKIREDIEKEQ